jgi:taurine dioxygenase
MAPEHVKAEQAEGRPRDVEFEHPLVRSNPVSGRKSLIISNRTIRIKGWSRTESKPLLDYLHQHATQAKLCLRQMWQVGDILLWDDRWLKHAGAADVLEASERELWRLVASVDMQTHEFVENPMSLTR